VLFGGAGGACLGIKRAGFDLAISVDIEKDMTESHKLNFPECNSVQADLLEFEDFPKDIDLVWSSSPCQDLSTANTNNRDIERGLRLARRAWYLIKEKIKPKFWVMENVRGISKYFPLKYYTLNAADYGVPQIRYREFITNVPQPMPTHSEFGETNLEGIKLKKWISAGEALNLKGTSILNNTEPSFRNLNAPSHSIRTNRTVRISEHSPEDVAFAWKYGSHGKQKVGTREMDEPSPTVTAKNASGGLRIAEGEIEETEEIFLAWKYSNEYFSQWRTRELDQPAPTINTMNRGGSLRLMQTFSLTNTTAKSPDAPIERPSRTVTSEPQFLYERRPSFTITATENRYYGNEKTGINGRRAGRMLGRQLTPEECAKLQGFPPDFQFIGNKSSRYTQIGNAVPPPVAEAIARVAIGLLRS
jgi:DNA-cytosine methyltransferase